MKPSPSLGAAIPAYRNADKLRACLTALRNYSAELFACCTVVDDSGDGRVADALRNEFPSVAWIVHSINRGFGQSANEAVSSCPADVVVLLNDDVQILTDPAPHLRDAFSHSDLFALSFQAQRADGNFREGAKRLIWPVGFPRILHNRRDQQTGVQHLEPSAYAVGGHAAFSREKFLALGGFDPLFDPFYWEDVDLCERARKRGWRTAYCPECRVFHAEHGAIHSISAETRIREVTQRNRLLFAWRHVPAHLKPLLALSLAGRLAASALTADHVFVHAYKAARERWHQQSSLQQSLLSP